MQPETETTIPKPRTTDKGVGTVGRLGDVAETIRGMIRGDDTRNEARGVTGDGRQDTQTISEVGEIQGKAGDFPLNILTICLATITELSLTNVAKCF